MENKTTEQWQALTELKPFLQKAWEASGFEKPTAIQAKVLEPLVQGKDAIFESPTGTGKTVAYLLPMLHHIDEEKKSIQAVFVAPTKELAMQIFEEIQKWTKNSDLTVASFIGGANIKRQLDKLKKRPQIAVGTIDRMKELIQMKKLKMHEVKSITVDEIDQIIANKHVNGLKDIINSAVRDRQLVFTSATISEEAEQVGKDIMNEPEVIRVSEGGVKDSNVEHAYIVCERRDKIDTLRKIIHTDEFKALAFVNDLEKIEEVAEKLRYKKVKLEVLEGQSSKIDRKKAISQFRAGKVPLLLATDVASRGLDIEGLTHVVQFDFPRNAASYTHRAGRTGRMGRSGTVISIVTPQEEKALIKLAKQLGIFAQKKEVTRGKLVDVKK
jgi:superfamily II DNA/RNA helicase